MRLIFCLLSVQTLLAGQIKIEVSARSAILMNADTGVVLFEKSPYLSAYPASTTKIATALYVLDSQVDLHQQIAVSREALRGRPLKERDECPPYWLDVDGTIMGLKVGEVLSMEALLHGLMMLSGNDAANVIAESVSGSIPRFVESVNEYLGSIGCKNTQFSNPHGLTHPDHWSCAYDLAVITRRALQNPKFRSIFSCQMFTRLATNKQPESEIKGLNPLMKPKSRYYYPKAIGAKRGYTQAARYTLVAAAEHEGRTLIGVVLGCEQKNDHYEDVRKMFESAFAEEKASRRLVGPENVFAKTIAGSASPLKARVLKPLSISFFPSEEPRCKAALHWSVDRPPIRKGQKVGELQILDDRHGVISRADLIAAEEVKGTFFFLLREKFSNFLR